MAFFVYSYDSTSGKPKVSAIQTANLLLADGTVALTANWAIGAFDITTTQDPQSANSLTRRSWVEGALAAVTVADATSAPGGGTKGIITADSLKGLSITAGVLGAKVDESTLWFVSGSGEIAVADAGINEAQLNSAVDAQTFDATHTAINYTAIQVGTEGTAKISAHLKGIDNELGTVKSGLKWKTHAHVITDDADLNAAADGTELSTLLPFSDDDAPAMVIGDFAAGQYIISRNNTGTHKRFLVYDDATVLKVTTAAVEQPVDGFTYIIKNDLTDSPDARENLAIFHVDGALIIKIGDIDFALATGIDLSSLYEKAVSTTVEPAAGDSVETAIAKIHAGALGADSITPRVLGAIVTANEGVVQDLNGALGVDYDNDTLGIVNNKLALKNRNYHAILLTNNTGVQINTGSAVALSKTVSGEVVLANNADADYADFIGVAVANIATAETGPVAIMGRVPVTTDGTDYDLGKWVYVAGGADAGKGTKTPPTTGDRVRLGKASGTGEVVLANQWVG